jgi:c-di-AMP phosphodiesterase-like protein
MDVWVWITDKRAGMIMTVCVVIYAAIVAVMYFKNKEIIVEDVVQFANQFGSIQKKLLQEMTVPYALLYSDGKVMWMNNGFEKIVGEHLRVGDRYISSVIPELNSQIFPVEEDKPMELEVHYEGRDYQVELRKVLVNGMSDIEELFSLPQEKEYFITVYFTDVTDINAYARETENQRLVSGLICIDNYDEIMRNVEEVRQSLLAALIDRKINQYILNANGIIRKLEKDKYYTVFQKKDLMDMEEDKFSVLEDVKSINIGNDVPPTLSIGLGLSAESYNQSYNYSRVAIDLALARGGDQVVVKDCNGLIYFGGRREQTAKNARVKARVKAEALREFMITRDRIIVMGHKVGDVDSFGASIGIYRAGVTLGKPVHIVLDEPTVQVRQFQKMFVNNSEYPSDMFVTTSEVADLVNSNTMVVVVDTNRPSYTECEALLSLTKTVAVLDHHRQGSESISNAVLSYIEPYASSACEMVSEVLQYIADDVKIRNIEADCMYAGIMVDTNNFTNKTGVRTFEAAAFLRRCGADITHVRKIFRDDMDAFRLKASMIQNTELYREVFAISTCVESKGVESPTIIGAQAANELLNIDGIKASFVLTTYNGKIYVSARSIDEINVQLIMEKIGGGGHMTTAGAQFLHTDMYTAVLTLKATINEMIDKGEI